MVAAIYVVDDDSSARRSLARLLKAHGSHVQTFPSAESLLSASPDYSRGCFIIDERLPGMSGLELLDYMRQAGFAGPAIVMSAYGGDGLAEKALARGAVAFLAKPFDEDSLLAVIALLRA